MPRGSIAQFHQNPAVSLRRKKSNTESLTPFRPDIGCATVIAGGDPMPAPAKAREAPIEALPLEECIQRRAYELYVERGNQSGSELDDWLQAEQEVLQTQESHQQRDWSQR
jgi:hypothetical protein